MVTNCVEAEAVLEPCLSVDLDRGHDTSARFTENEQSRGR